MRIPRFDKGEYYWSLQGRQSRLDFIEALGEDGNRESGSDKDMPNHYILEQGSILSTLINSHVYV